MKIAIIGDLHIGVKSSNEVMMRHQARFFNFFLNELKNRGVCTIIQLGDIWDNRRQVNFRALQFAQETFFEPINDAGIELHTLIGNHDIFYRETLDINSSGLLLRPYKHIHVYDEPTTLNFEKISFDIIPWMCNDNKNICMEYMNNSKSDYCCGHFEINNFEVMKGIPYENGIDEEKFGKYKQVFSGHFHIRSHRGNITYVGTPYELTWGDYNTPKGFLIFDTETNSWEYVENPITYFYYITYDEIGGYITNLDKMDLADCYIKLVIRSKKEEFIYNNFINKLFKMKPADIKFVETNFMNLNESATIMNSNKIEVKDVIDLIKDYINGTDYDRKDDLKAFFIDLYREAAAESEKL